MLKKIFENTKKPEGFLGKMIIFLMNKGHSSGSKWGLSHLSLKNDDDVLDVGCGGGVNVALMLKECNQGTVTGIDYSPLSVEVSRKKNRKAVEEGKCNIIEGNVLSLPFEDEKFNVITAFETIYFWNPIEKAFKEVHRVLKHEGTFLICTETDGRNRMDEKWKKLIDGMEVYTAEELEQLLTGSGFSDIKISVKSENRWMCILATK